MIKNKIKLVNHFLNKLTNPETIAVLGVIVFLIQSIVFVFTRLPNFDEGSYLLKGYLYAQGVYKPFQPYGFWMIKMYLSFYPWGWLQTITSPGLLTTRMFAIFLNLLSLIGVWILTCRMGNRWLAAGAIWVLALNSSLISIYSMANSQVLVACILTWVLVFTLGEKRSPWQLGVGMALSGLMVLTRENMIFVLPFLVLYIIWQNGWKKGLFGLTILAFVMTIGHILFWPDILYLWKRWLPHDLFLASNVTNEISNSIKSGPGMVSNFHSLSMAIRIHYFAIIGSILLFCLWPKKDVWQKQSYFRAAVFLGITYVVLLASHTWAALTSPSCIYCANTYFAFFDVVGILFCVILLQNLNLKPGFFSATIVTLTIVTSMTAIWFSLFEQLGSSLLMLPFPRIRNNQFIPGWATLWDILNNKFYIAYNVARMYVPIFFGLLCGIFLLVLVRVIFNKVHDRYVLKGMTFTSFSVLFCMMMFFVFSPLLTRPYGEPICRKDVIAPYEQFGNQLATIAPAGTKIYLDGSTTSVLLLYTPGVIILPPQINDVYSRRNSTNSDALLKAGTWNEEIATKWRNQADVFIIELSRLETWKDYFQVDKFDNYIFSLTSSNCPVEIETAYFV